MMADLPENKENSAISHVEFCHDYDDNIDIKDDDDTRANDNDDEVFIGQLTTKEQRRAASYEDRQSIAFQKKQRYQITRHTMDTLSVMSPNQQLLQDTHSKDQSGFLGTSLPVVECPLLSENKSVTFDAPRPLVVDLASKAFSMLLGIKNPALSVNGLNMDVANKMDINRLDCQKDMSDAVIDRKENPLCADRSVENDKQATGQSECCSGNYGKSECDSGNCGQTSYNGNQSDQSDSCCTALSEIKKDCTLSQCMSNPVDQSVTSETSDQMLEHSESCSRAPRKTGSISCSQTNGEICRSNDSTKDITEQQSQNLEAVSLDHVDNRHLNKFSESAGTVSELAHSDRTIAQVDHLERGVHSYDQPDRRTDGFDCYQKRFQNMDGSPLVNSCANANHPSPQIIFGDIKSMHGKTVRNIFSQSSSGKQSVDVDDGDYSDPELSMSHLALSDNEQEVPYKMLDASSEREFLKFGTDLVPCQQATSGADDRLAKAADGLLAEVNSGAHKSEDQSSGSPQCRLVPDIALSPENLRTGHLQTPVSARTGVVFTEQKFSPMLTVIASPNHSNETSPTDRDVSKNNSSTQTPKKVQLPGQLPVSLTNSQLHQTAAADGQLQCSPLTAADVRFTFVKESPRKAKLKRLNATKVTSPDSAHLNSVFERLSKVNKVVDLQTESSNVDKIRATKITPIKHVHSAHKVSSSPRLNVASQLRIMAGMKGALPQTPVFENNRQKFTKAFGSSEKMTRKNDFGYVRNTHGAVEYDLSTQCKTTVTNLKGKCDSTSKKRTKIRTFTMPQNDFKDGGGGSALRGNSKLEHLNMPQSNTETRHSSLTKNNSKVRHNSTQQKNSIVRHSSSPQSNLKIRHSGTPQCSYKGRHTSSVFSNSKNRHTGAFPGNSKVGQVVKPQGEPHISRYCTGQNSSSSCAKQRNNANGRCCCVERYIRSTRPGGSAQQTPTGQHITDIASHPPAAMITPRSGSPALPVYRNGTPRYGCDAHRGLKMEPLGKLDLDLSDTDICDLSSLDESIILQEKKVELERVQAEKLRLEKKLAEQAQNMKQSASHHQRSALRPSTVENMPRMRFNDTYTLNLSEPELDAITLVHTLCNSQQIVKRVTKAHATAVIGQNYVVRQASKVKWHEELVTDVQEVPRKDYNTVIPKPILRVRTPGFIYPYNDQPPPSVVVVKSSRKCLAYGKEASPLMSKLLI